MRRYIEGMSLHGNDAQALLSALALASGADSTSAGVAEVLSRLRGPWALVYWEEAARRLWYGRDVVGRRSLLMHRPDAVDARWGLMDSARHVIDTI